MKDGSNPPSMPSVGSAPSHYHSYIDCCLRGGRTASDFAMASRMTAWGFMGNLAQLRPGERLDCSKLG